jgi:hypothetical protein
MDRKEPNLERDVAVLLGRVALLLADEHAEVLADALARGRRLDDVIDEPPRRGCAKAKD